MSESDYAHETLARVLSLRDAFVALFFVTLGALIDPRVALSNLPLLAVMIGLVLVGKLVLWTGVVALFGYSLWTALLVGVGLTQIGEFSFILVQAARDAGLVGADVYNATLATALVTILANAALVRFAPGWLSRAAPDRALGADRRPAGRRRRPTWSCAGSGGSAARSARPWRRSAFATWPWRPIRTSCARCAPAGCRASTATPPTRTSWRRPGPPMPRWS